MVHDQQILNIVLSDENGVRGRVSSELLAHDGGSVSFNVRFPDGKINKVIIKSSEHYDDF